VNQPEPRTLLDLYRTGELMNAEKQRAYRERLRGGPPRQPQPHGTRAAIRRHERASEPLCDECRLERNRLARERYAAVRVVAGTPRKDQT
jgi:hypothetical protein